MSKRDVIRALVIAVAFTCAAGSAWAWELAPARWRLAGWLDPAAIGAVASLVIGVALSSLARRKERAPAQPVEPRAGQGATVTPISTELRQGGAASSSASLRVVGRKR